MEARFFLYLCLVFLLVIKTEGFSDGVQRSLESLFVFGDSAVDTGNCGKNASKSWKLPYGSTFPGKPTGRFSDGRVLTDFIAAHLGNPSPIPYKMRRFGGSRNRYGMNFAFGGTGVFDTGVLLPNLTTQIDFFEQLINQGTYRSSELRSSMALISASSNDYASYVLKKGSLQGLDGFIGLVVNQLSVDLLRLSRLGVGKVVVAGVAPLGCTPVVTQVGSYSTCIDLINQYVTHHNSLLRTAVDAINARLGRPSRVAVLDLYGAIGTILQGNDNQGARFNDPLRPCCVGVDSSSSCGSIDEHGKPLYRVSGRAGSTFFWDSVHPTQAGWSEVAGLLLPALQHFLS